MGIFTTTSSPKKARMRLVDVYKYGNKAGMSDSQKSKAKQLLVASGIPQSTAGDIVYNNKEIPRDKMSKVVQHLTDGKVYGFKGKYELVNKYAKNEETKKPDSTKVNRATRPRPSTNPLNSETPVSKSSTPGPPKVNLPF